MAADEGRKRGLKVGEYLPDWKGLGRSAGFARNKTIIEACDVVKAFWDGTSKGTAHSIELAKKLGKPWTVEYDDATR